MTTSSTYCAGYDDWGVCNWSQPTTMVGYISPTPFASSIPVYQIPSDRQIDMTTSSTYCAGYDDWGVCNWSQPTTLVGYIAPSQGTFGGSCVCPLGNQYSCMANPNAGGAYQCSPYSCQGGINQVMDPSSYQNDGQKDASGNCLGQIYIFSGQPDRCRPPGLTVGELNNCCAGGQQVIPENTGSNLGTYYSMLTYIYKVGQVGYGSYLASQGADGMAAAGEYATEHPDVSNAIASAEEGIANGEEGSQAFMDGLSTFTTDMLASPAIIFAIVVFVAMKVLMGGGCDAMDVQTTMARDSGMCHVVGGYCEKSFLGTCIQHATGYCCFNSKFGRILEEQGRPQLPAFGRDGGWGDPGSPNCRGMTPNEMASLDYNLIHLDEYYVTIESDLANKFSGPFGQDNNAFSLRW